MNNTKINIYKKVLQEVCEKFNNADDFVRERTEELCNKKKLSAEEVSFIGFITIITFKLFVHLHHFECSVILMFFTAPVQY